MVVQNCSCALFHSLAVARVFFLLDVQDYWIRKPPSRRKATALEQELQLLFWKQFLSLRHMVSIFQDATSFCLDMERDPSKSEMDKVLADAEMPHPDVLKVFVNALAMRKELWNGFATRADLEERLKSAVLPNLPVFQAESPAIEVNCKYVRAWRDFLFVGNKNAT